MKVRERYIMLAFIPILWPMFAGKCLKIWFNGGSVLSLWIEVVEYHKWAWKN